VQPAGAGARELLTRTPLDDGDIDAGELELGRKRQPRWTTPSDHHRVRCQGPAQSRSIVHVRSSLPLPFIGALHKVRHAGGLVAIPRLWHTLDVGKDGVAHTGGSPP